MEQHVHVDVLDEEVVGDVDRTGAQRSQGLVVDGLGQHLEGTLLAADGGALVGERTERVVVAERERDPAGLRSEAGNATDLRIGSHRGERIVEQRRSGPVATREQLGDRVEHEVGAGRFRPPRQLERPCGPGGFGH
jgi:hypothetical protein